MAIRGKTAYLAVVGDANRVETWSGIPHHLLQAGRATGTLDVGLALAVDGAAWKARRAIWNLWRVVSRQDRPGGYQYSVAFLERLWRQERRSLAGSLVVNCFQLYPPSLVSDAGIEKWFYVDQTLWQLFDHYGVRARIGASIAREALEREAEGYRRAAGVIAHSRWAAESVIGDCGIARDKVHVVVAGASWDAATYQRWERQAASRVPGPQGPSPRPPRLVFVGKDWRRKGLDRLLRALALVRGRGLEVTLRVIGCAQAGLPPDLQQVAGVEWVGFVDKRGDALRLMNLVAECDLGCQLSRAEAGGIAQREFHALGLAILGTDVGGAPEHRFPDASVGVPAQASDEAVAEAILQIAGAPERLQGMKQAAWARRREALWAASVERLESIISSASPARGS